MRCGLNDFSYKDGVAHCEGLALSDLATTYGTPLYVYSANTLRRHLRDFRQALEGLNALCAFAVKSNSNLTLLSMIKGEGFGADIVSGGELQRCLKAGFSPDRIVFSGVGKRSDELELAVEKQIFSINVESLFELKTLVRVKVSEDAPVNVCLRLNFDIHAATSDKIKTGALDSKFGIPIAELPEAMRLLKDAPKALRLRGLACHVGSQILDLAPFSAACQLLVQTASELRAQGLPIEFVDVGGGLGIRYKDENPPTLQDYADVLRRCLLGQNLKLVTEPGRVLVGNAGIAITKVLGVKRNPQKRFVVVDAGMNDLPRFAIYGAYHEILSVAPRQGSQEVFDIVGPVCESTDALGKNRDMVEPMPGEYLFVRGAGAYCASMASTYNTRPIAPEVLVDGNSVRLIRRRQTIEELWAQETNEVQDNAK